MAETRHRHKMGRKQQQKNPGKWQKRKIERDKCKGTCNGPFFWCNIALATGLSARTFFAARTAQPVQRPSPSTISSGEKLYGNDIGTKWQKQKQGNSTSEKLNGANARGRVTGHFFVCKNCTCNRFAGTYILCSYDSTACTTAFAFGDF